MRKVYRFFPGFVSLLTFWSVMFCSHYFSSTASPTFAARIFAPDQEHVVPGILEVGLWGVTSNLLGEKIAHVSYKTLLLYLFFNGVSIETFYKIGK